ncbi:MULTISPECIES: tRNA glutamyl-Q(34) synthetase GluQRS [unclassified Arthrobacter]|uniref:tRNA glutamyl-Q(34) synthetase GluQRS n=1 Tax=unclassified Arthrobacter TaxID=235627 RepID=UPI00149176E1|nr:MULTISPECIES: tRNA glutamyl-Q(34) synthetase GluQRS [unclassified Arthrobacter]MBE0008230.1 tRNA glutamyl-Q(34) synthetase GluQRS [Arthrobacter sp. AET 35A]NOJ61969.1 tRNA glutamyl-Q(34) synthetase GluQRS [Arthrobacter sp. 147(2020)]
MNSPGAGRFAPSPSGELHVGNLRTAMLAWLFARSTSREFLVRIEDLDRSRAGAEAAQLAELAAVGIDWDHEPARQSDRLPLYQEAIDSLREAGLLYECYCTRRDIAEAATAPHSLPGSYPGTCRTLSKADRDLPHDRPPALRLRSGVTSWTVEDQLHGAYTGPVDDLVIVRSDGVPAYNLAVVVDDAAQGVDQVVRGDDLLSSTPRQAYLAGLLGLAPPRYAHVPLALNQDGQRLAKRDGAVTLESLAGKGLGPDRVRDLILRSAGLPEGTLAGALEAFDPAGLPREAWVVQPGELS